MSKKPLPIRKLLVTLSLTYNELRILTFRKIDSCVRGGIFINVPRHFSLIGV